MDTDDGRRKLAEFLATQPMTSDITYEQVAKADSREDLGISSLNMIMLLMSYIKEHTNDTVTLRPEWVPRLVNVDGIVAVLHEIDDSAVEGQKATQAQT
jgi:hypothetical protein